ncbi:MAG: hypothetical protein LBU45_06465 [Azoarcus sp.]|jgi:hypothetical protein|nr:hypothetical protein [Azoarcus sp.]
MITKSEFEFSPLLFAALLVVTGGAATAQELPPETPEAIRRDMATIEKYRAEVEKRTGANRDREQGDAGFTPLSIAPPRAPITPELPRRAIDEVERDPFEVSPRLREANNRASRAGMQEGMALNRALRLVAVVRGPGGGLAKVKSGQEELVVHDGDELDVNGIRYTVTVEADGLMLRGTGAPQYKMLVR